MLTALMAPSAPLAAVTPAAALAYDACGAEDQRARRAKQVPAEARDRTKPALAGDAFYRFEPVAATVSVHDVARAVAVPVRQA